MARIPYFDSSLASIKLKQAIGKQPPLNIIRILSHSEPATIGFLSFGSALLRNNNDLDSKLREIVIIRVGILCKSEYEIFQHKRLAKKLGVSDEKIEALEIGAEALAFDDLESKILIYTDAVVKNIKADINIFKSIENELSHRAMVELTLTIGFYMMVSRVLENFEVEIENSLSQ